jgi:hypothetical protein
MAIPEGGTDTIRICMRAAQSELIAEVKILIRDYYSKEVEELLQFDINVSK